MNSYRLPQTLLKTLSSLQGGSEFEDTIPSTRGQQLGHSCSQVHYEGTAAVADMEQMLKCMTTAGDFVLSPQAVLSIMELSFGKIKEVLLSAANNGSFGERQSPEPVEDSLSLIIDDLALGRHTL